MLNWTREAEALGSDSNFQDPAALLTPSDILRIALPGVLSPSVCIRLSESPQPPFDESPQ
jgi:hypothetical protein